MSTLIRSPDAWYSILVGRLHPFEVSNLSDSAKVVDYSCTFPAAAVVRAIRWRSYDAHTERLVFCGAGLRQAWSGASRLMVADIKRGVSSPVRVPREWHPLSDSTILRLSFAVNPKCRVVGTIEVLLVVRHPEEG